MQQPDPYQKLSLQVQQLSLAIGEKKIIKNISFDISSGKKVVLVGLNGAGKSSLIRLLIGELRPQHGEICFHSHHPGELTFKDKLGYQACGMLPLANLSVREYLDLCCQLKNSLKQKSQAHIEKAVKQWRLDEIIERPMEQLSQGNLQKLSIAQAFLGTPDTIILDEPTQALDPIEQQRFIDNLLKLKEFQLCLFSSHHVSETVAAADLVLMLHHGKLVALLDLQANDEYWLMSTLSLNELRTQINAMAAGITLSLIYQQRDNLFRLQGLNPEIWARLVRQLAEKDNRLVGLGSASQSLMPLFSLLANEGL